MDRYHWSLRYRWLHHHHHSLRPARLHSMHRSLCSLLLGPGRRGCSRLYYQWLWMRVHQALRFLSRLVYRHRRYQHFDRDRYHWSLRCHCLHRHRHSLRPAILHLKHCSLCTLPFELGRKGCSHLYCLQLHLNQ